MSENITAVTESIGTVSTSAVTADILMTALISVALGILITLFYGEDVDEEAAEATANRISLAFPDAELTPIPGGQPVYYYMISVE